MKPFSLKLACWDCKRKHCIEMLGYTCNVACLKQCHKATLAGTCPEMDVVLLWPANDPQALQIISSWVAVPPVEAYFIALLPLHARVLCRVSPNKQPLPPGITASQKSSPQTCNMAVVVLTTILLTNPFTLQVKGYYEYKCVFTLYIHALL